MVHRLTEVEVKGFWGNHDFKCKINPDVTFFIGANGTGKTTFINLVAAVLNADLLELDSLSFDSIKINFATKSPKNKGYVLVKKSKRLKNIQRHSIDYEIKSPNKEKVDLFSLDDLAVSSTWSELRASIRNYHEFTRFHQPAIQKKLQELFGVSWLTINRSSSSEKLKEEKSYRNTIDLKINALENELIKYFSSLTKQKETEVRNFQEKIFLSLLDVPSLDTLPAVPVFSQKEVLENIFDDLNVSEKLFRKKMENFYNEAEQSRIQFKKELSRKKREFNVDLIFSLLSIARIGTVMEDWIELRKKISEIYTHQDDFLNIINRLFQRKTICISENNEIYFKTQSGKELTPLMLSSGEKQILILLGEALLQRQKPYVFITDEPELSLHVTWQEVLIDSIRSLNSSAQIIIATHSPDIIGNKSKKVINMESLIK